MTFIASITGTSRSTHKQMGEKRKRKKTKKQANQKKRKILDNISDCTKILLLQLTDQIANIGANRGK